MIVHTRTGHLYKKWSAKNKSTGIFTIAETQGTHQFENTSAFENFFAKYGKEGCEEKNEGCNTKFHKQSHLYYKEMSLL